jgi:hypothetical protein
VLGVKEDGLFMGVFPDIQSWLVPEQLPGVTSPEALPWGGILNFDQFNQI